MKLIRIYESPNPKKKWRAHFIDQVSGKHKNVDFGQAGAPDFTLTGDKEARDRYRTRHRKDLASPNNAKGVGAGALAWYVLWGDSKSMRENIAHYKNVFHL